MIVSWLVTSLLLAGVCHVVLGLGFCAEPYEPLTGESGELLNPGYPMGVYPDFYCDYLIVAPKHHYIILNLIEVETWTNMPNPDDCYSSDFIEIYSYSYDRSLAYFCGYFENSDRWLGRGFYIYVDAHGKGNESPYTTYHFSWTTTDDESCTSGKTQQYMGDHGVITSPGYPGMYYNDLYCFQLITVCEGDTIRLEFEYMLLDNDYRCGKYDADYLHVFDGKYHDPLYQLSLYMCGCEPPAPLYSTMNQMLLDFDTNYMTVNKGYKAMWKQVYSPHDFTVMSYKLNNTNVQVWAMLVNKVGTQIPCLTRIYGEPEWTFCVTATSMDACDVHMTIDGVYDWEKGMVFFNFDLPMGHYMLEYRAVSYGPVFDISHSYTVYVNNEYIAKIKKDDNIMSESVTFGLDEYYDHYTQHQLDMLAQNLKVGFQLYLKHVYVVHVGLVKDEYGYIDVKVEVKGENLMLRLRKLCAVISSLHPFKFCYDGEVKPIKHHRSMSAFGRHFGYETPNKCHNSLFIWRVEKGCGCPCKCFGKTQVKVFSEQDDKSSPAPAHYYPMY